MKFVKATYREIKVGDYVSCNSNRVPLVFVYGYVRIINKEKIVQSKNVVQHKPDGTFYYIRPWERYFKKSLKGQNIKKLI